MTKLDLATLDGLREACGRIESAKRTSPASIEWMRELEEFLSWVAAADESTRATGAFQKRLWDENPVSNVGQGNIAVDHVLFNESFRQWLAHESVQKLPQYPEERTARLNQIYETLVERYGSLSTGNTPHLKMFRVLAALFPDDFTTIAHRRRLEELYKRMGGNEASTPITQHLFVRARIDAALGPSASSNKESAWRMAMAWYLYEALDAEIPSEDRVVKLGPVAEADSLVPLPAARRRRGLTAIRGYFSALPSILEFLREGASREDLLDYLKGAYPDYKESTLGSVINTLRGELAVITRNGNDYQLTPQGEAVLEGNEPSELGPWLMTRILGVDHVLKALEKGPKARSDLVALLQKVWPGWTSAYAPNALLSWLVSFRAIEKNDESDFALAPLGAEWTARIHWEPEFLVEEAEEIASPAATTVAPGSSWSLLSLAEIRSGFGQSDGYPQGTVDYLHLGLWSPMIRHFAVVTGISGSGKTRLAMRYAEVLTGTSAKEPFSRVHVEPVQPAWYDPAPLLGYVSPLKEVSYTRTGFLNFLLRAASDPNRPYVAVLDEMNLSHPEQYFAPILSAMETGGLLRFHAEGDIFDGVPESIPYPKNLAVIGTINMDETTHGLSDKVLDRAFVLEFSSIDMASYPGWAGRVVTREVRSRITEVLEGLLGALTPVRLHFGWRVVDDVVDFVALGIQELSGKEITELLDMAIYSKVIPKLRGEDNDNFQKALVEVQRTLEKHGLEKSRCRVQELTNDLRLSGSARFWR